MPKQQLIPLQSLLETIPEIKLDCLFGSRTIQQEIETSVDLRGDLERYLYLVSQAAIDLAEAIISFFLFLRRYPTTIATKG